MGYYKKWKPSKTAAREFAQKMDEIGDFCSSHGICQSRSGDSYYFTIGGTPYRVSNHTTAASDRGMYNDFGEKIRDSYHADDDPRTVYITAGKTRIIEIYNALKAGKHLDKRGYILEG